MNKRYVLDAAGVEAVNRAISRVGNTPPAMLDTNRRHRITVTEGGGYEYNGYFKVVNANEIGSDGSVKRKVKIINGSSPDSPNAGKSDLGYVRSATLEIPDQNMTEILLVAKYNENTKSYEQYFDYSFSGTVGAVSVLLATVDAMGTITQQWNNGAVYFGGRFFL